MNSYKKMLKRKRQEFFAQRKNRRIFNTYDVFMNYLSEDQTFLKVYELYQVYNSNKEFISYKGQLRKRNDVFYEILDSTNFKYQYDSLMDNYKNIANFSQNKLIYFTATENTDELVFEFNQNKLTRISNNNTNEIVDQTIELNDFFVSIADYGAEFYEIEYEYEEQLDDEKYLEEKILTYNIEFDENKEIKNFNILSYCNEYKYDGQNSYKTPFLAVMYEMNIDPYENDGRFDITRYQKQVSFEVVMEFLENFLRNGTL